MRPNWTLLCQYLQDDEGRTGIAGECHLAIKHPWSGVGGFEITLEHDPKKSPYILTDPDGRTTICGDLGYCIGEAERQAKDRSEFYR
jgi:hypothetical protein